MSTRTRLLAAFAHADGAECSGAQLAKRLGISRAAVWKQVQLLKQDGFPVVSRQRSGYRFLGALDPSLERWAAAGSHPAGVHPHYYQVTASTQDLARQGATAGLPEGHLWISEIQRSGRGRLSRRWDSGYGGLWFSILLRPRLPPSALPALSLVAGLSLWKALRHFNARLKIGLKWPNDVLVETRQGTRKLAGILVEMSGELERTHWAILGVGVNVVNRIPASLYKVAATLESLGDAPPRAALLERFWEEFSAAYRRFEAHGFAPLAGEYRKASWTVGRPVRVNTSQGHLSGLAVGVDADGGLLVKSRRKTHHLLEGEIQA